MHSAVLTFPVPFSSCYSSGVMMGMRCCESLTELMGFQWRFPSGREGYALKRLTGLGHSHLE